MIIKRKLFSNYSDEEELKQLRRKLTIGQKLAASGATAGVGAIFGTPAGKPGVVAGSIIGAATGAYLTSNYYRNKKIKELQERVDSRNASHNSYLENLKLTWEKQRPMTYDQFYRKFPKVKSDMDRIKFMEDYRFNDKSIPDYNQIRKEIWDDFDPKCYVPLGVQDNYESSYVFYDIKTGDYINVWGDIGEPERIKLDDYKNFYS